MFASCTQSQQNIRPEPDKNKLNISRNLSHQKLSIKPSKDDKVFIKEYTYLASEDDSRNSSREKAINQIKLLLSEEIGTQIESYLEINNTVTNGVSHKIIKQEISSLSIAITKLKVLNENWDGKKYYIKASVFVNIDKAMVLLLEAIKARSNEKDVKRLNKILAEQKKALESSSDTIKKQNKKLITQEILLEAKKSETIKLKEQLIQFNKEQEEYNRQIKEQNIELSNIKKRISESKKRIARKGKKACLLERGMTQSEVRKIIGHPDSVLYRTSPFAEWYYGNVQVKFQNYLVGRVYRCR